MRRFALSAVLTGMAAALTVTAGIAAFSADSPDRPGDVDVDSRVSVADAVLLARYCAEDPEAVVTVQGIRNADCNSDGFVSADDSGVLLGYLAGVNRDLDWPEETTVSAETVQNSATDESFNEEQTTVSETETTAASSSETDVQNTEPAALVVGNRILPLGFPAAEVTALPALISEYGDVTEVLNLVYHSCVMDFYVYAENPADTLIMLSRDGIVIGYYTTASEYTCSEHYTITEYHDTHPDGTGEIYAVLALHSSGYLVVDSVADPTDLSVFGKLNYYVTNAIRGINGVGPLRWNPALAAGAQAHSLALASYTDGKIEQPHLDPVTGSTPTDRIVEAVGPGCKPTGENVDKGFRHPFSSAHKWYISTGGHRETMLNPRFTDIGVGYGYLPQTNIFGTQDYASIPE